VVQDIRQHKPRDLLCTQPIKPNFSRIITPIQREYFAQSADRRTLLFSNEHSAIDLKSVAGFLNLR
jgi:hypothetical protein